MPKSKSVWRRSLPQKAQVAMSVPGTGKVVLGLIGAGQAEESETESLVF